MEMSSELNIPELLPPHLAVAVHEAAHTIVARELGFTVTRVQISEKDGYLPGGNSTVAFEGATDDDRLLVTMAGPAAEWIYPLGYTRDSDENKIWSRPGMTKSRYDAYFTDACRILEAREADVLRLADALDARGELSGAEIESVLSGVNVRSADLRYATFAVSAAPASVKARQDCDEPNKVYLDGKVVGLARQTRLGWEVTDLDGNRLGEVRDWDAVLALAGEHHRDYTGHALARRVAV
jgi:hypothetical protein